MRFTTQRGKLSTAIANVSRAVAVRSAIQSLEGVLIRIRENEIELILKNKKHGFESAYRYLKAYKLLSQKHRVK